MESWHVLVLDGVRWHCSEAIVRCATKGYIERIRGWCVLVEKGAHPRCAATHTHLGGAVE